MLKPLGLALGLFASATLIESCSAERVLTTASELQSVDLTAHNHLPSVRISEIHYDNAGTDAGEAIEISGPAGTNLTGYSLILYNGNGGAAYDNRVLSGTIPGTCGTRGVVVQTYASNGIQNGSPDGVALVSGTTVIEFLSYEGTFTAVGGAANGLVSKDIGVSQAGTEAIGSALQREGTGVWKATPGANSFGACNDTETQQPVVASVTVQPSTGTVIVGQAMSFEAIARDAANQPIDGISFNWASAAPSIATVGATGTATGIAPGQTEIRATAPNGVSGVATLRVDPAPPQPPTGPVNIVELHYDNTGTDVGEAFEVEGPAGMNLQGWTVVLYSEGVTYGTPRALSGLLADQCDGRGTLAFTYPSNGIQNGPKDGLALVSPAGTVVELLSYEGTFTATNGVASGMTSTDIGVSENGTEPAGKSLQKDAQGWYGPATASFGSCNQRPQLPPSFIAISGRDDTDPALPVGFQDQLFGREIDGNGNEVATTIAWSSDTPTIASVDPTTGVMTALAAGTAVIRATAASGTSSTKSLAARVASPGAALYANHVEFGTPVDGDPSDDFIVQRREFTASFNQNRGIPNWVSFNIEATHFGPEDRCDCFTYDPVLPPAFPRYTTADYTGAGTFHGYGIDRGHLARSFDRTSGSLDNARTFYFTNIIPQAADNNQGPWSAMESHIGDLARLQNKEIFVVAGASGSKGTVKNEGKITIPAQVWKVAVILGRDQGLANVARYTDVEVIAAIMPNDPGVRSVDWRTYVRTVDDVEALSGYNLLSALPDEIERIVEANIKPPFALLNGPYTGNEGMAVSMSGAASYDPNGSIVSYAWDFGDGQTGSGVTASHSYAQEGLYTVTLTVTDNDGLTSVTQTSVTVANVAPSIPPFPGAILLPGETYSATGSFADPGADTWSATADYGSGPQPLALSAMSFSLSHTYAAAGTYTVGVAINDGTVTTTRTATVVVDSWTTGIDKLGAALAGLNLPKGNANSLQSKLDAARRQIEADRTNAPSHMLDAFINEIEAMVGSGRLTGAAAEPLLTYARRLRASIGGGQPS
jgi:DNA/RNA endonuclease G (NUC1)